MFDEGQFADNDFQISKKQVEYNKNQQGLLLRHTQAVHFCPKQYNEEMIKYMANEYSIKSEYSKQVYGEQEVETIRWRKNKDGKIESNAKIVKWDDGTCHLMIGDKFFNMPTKDFTGEVCTMYERPQGVNENSALTDQIVPQIQITKMAAIQKSVTNFK